MNSMGGKSRGWFSTSGMVVWWGNGLLVCWLDWFVGMDRPGLAGENDGGRGEGMRNGMEWGNGKCNGFR